MVCHASDRVAASTVVGSAKGHHLARPQILLLFILRGRNNNGKPTKSGHSSWVFAPSDLDGAKAPGAS